MSLNFGVHLPIHATYGYEDVLKTSILADKLGYDYITVGDHFYLPSRSYRRIGGDPDKPDKLDAWATLAALAARTKGVKLSTRVSPMPFYLPARLAKIVATVDIISGGRAILGVGAAWHEEEAVAYGVGWGNHKERIERMMEGVEIILRLWSEDKTTFRGNYYRVLEAPFWPKPIQKPHPQIWFGGASKAIIDATAKYGDGVFPLTDTPPDKLKDLNNRLRKAEKKQCRKTGATLAPSLSYPEGIGKTPSQWIENVEVQKSIGAGLILLDFSTTYAPPGKAQLFLKDFAGKVLTKFRAL